MRISEEYTLFGDSIEIGSADHVVNAPFAIDFGVDARIAPPVVGKEE